jgi:hypothetical protein
LDALALIDDLANRKWFADKGAKEAWHLYYDRRRIDCQLVVGALGVMLRWYGAEYTAGTNFYVNVKLVRDS